MITFEFVPNIISVSIDAAAIFATSFKILCRRKSTVYFTVYIACYCIIKLSDIQSSTVKSKFSAHLG